VAARELLKIVLNADGFNDTLSFRFKRQNLLDFITESRVHSKATSWRQVIKVDHLVAVGHFNFDDTFFDYVYLVDDISTLDDLAASKVSHAAHEVDDLFDGLFGQGSEVRHVANVFVTKLRVWVIILNKGFTEVEVDGWTSFLHLFERCCRHT
jgi:hypothetical protein